MKLIKLLRSLVFTACCTTALSCTAEEQTLSTQRIDELFSFATEQYKKATDSLDPSDGMPRNSHADGSWRQVQLKDWTTGFFPGCLWYLYEQNQNEYWLAEAQKWTKQLEPLKTFNGHHDVGFMIYCSYGNGYRLTKDPAYKAIILEASDSLATRYRPTAQVIQSWGSMDEKNPKSYRVIIDNMMNLEMLLWAAENGGNENLRNIALTHANTTLENHFRPDGSNYHLLEYDPKTGEVIAKKTAQGFADNTMWARGQTWGIYGFTMMYRETGDKTYLQFAEKIADAYMKRLPADGVPLWDFDAPDDLLVKDASAGAIASSAFLDLYELTGNKRYLKQAEKTLAELSSDRYLAKGADYQCVLLHSVGHMPKRKEVDVNVNYADYYYLEALTRLKKIRQQGE
ncbi:glycoside hydrolase family 88 protein [Pontiellaceae bacterium B1224]|nr:glycoside hydrolase family 88 protein [Pontiellaceae bacterium B1224]